MKKAILKTAVFSLLVGTLFTSCDKSDGDANTGGIATVNMHLTDGPAHYDAVYLDIQEVAIKMENHATDNFYPIRPGVYDILRFRNGLDTLLLTAAVPAGKIEQIRLKLGTHNSVVVDGITEPLNTPSGQTSGVKLNLHEALLPGVAYDIWIDFDAGKSIVATGNGKYNLKPVIRTYADVSNGMIEGYATPLSALPVVYAIMGTDTFTAIPDPSSAYFKLSGLTEGMYQIWIDVENPLYDDTMISNVKVEYGKINDLGQIVLNPLP